MSTIEQTRQAILRREITIMETVQNCLNRIKRLEPSLRAWVHVDETGCLEQAERLHSQLKDGQAVGSLFGIPIGVKDIVDVAGLPIEAGTKYRRGRIANADAPVVEKMRQCGAVIIGKTVTTELACFDPSITRNPWNLDHTPGGSSSGSAAAVAAGMCLAAIGSQTGGSITRPATYCGVAGWKPTFDRNPLLGVEPVTFHLDHVGPLANTVADLESFSDVFADGNTSSDQPAWSNNGPTIGVLRDFFFDESDEETSGIVEESMGRLIDGGADIVTVKLPDGFDSVHQMHWRIMAVEAAHFHRHDFRNHADEMGPKVSSLIQEGLQTDLFEYTAALAHRKVFHFTVDGTWREVDVLLTPATPTPAPRDLSTTGDPRFNSPWSYAGLPTVSFTCGENAAGLPVGVQLVGKRKRDRELLKIAHWCEQQIGFRESSKNMTDL